MHKNERLHFNPRFLLLFVVILLLTSCFKTTPEPLLPGVALGSGEPVSGQGEGSRIAMIQGAAHLSPMRGQTVADVVGVVTVVKSDGFWFQSLKADKNPATSEGIFVFTDWVPSVKVGDAVNVSGRVEEIRPGGNTANLSRTQIMDAHISVLSSGNPLPVPVIIGADGRMPPTEVIDDDSNGILSKNRQFDPESDGLDFYESLEGMLVQVNRAVVVGPTNPYKEIVVLGDLGAHASLRTPRGGIVIRENDFNPERIILDDLLVALPFVKVGDMAAGPVIGVVDYDYGNFKLLVIQTPQFVDGGLARERADTESDPGYLRIASYNVENLSASQPQRISTLAEQIVNHMGSPDIIGLQEIMDNDGEQGNETASADQTYRAIIDGIEARGGPEYAYVNIDPTPDAEGGIPLGNIRVGFLYRLDRGLQLAPAPHGDARTAVEIRKRDGKPELTLNPGRIDPAHPAFFGSRRSLVVAFLYQGRPLFVVNNHFVSKGVDQPLFGEFQPPFLESEAQRIRQAEVVHDFVADILKIDPQSRVVVLGDLNDFQFSPPLAVLEGRILSNLIKTLPAGEQYTYVYEGNSQAMDHLLVSNALFEDLVAMDVIHLNTEFDYTVQFSDHDIPLATFDLD